MTPNIPCYLIRDLLPTYVDGLTSDETSRAIEDHVAACETCRTLLNEMRAPTPVEPAPEDAPQVDYLKKVRRDGTRRSLRNGILWGVVLAAVILAAVWRLVPRDLRSIVPLDDVETMDVHLTATVPEDNDFVTYSMVGLTPDDRTEKFDISYDFLMDTLNGVTVRPSFRNLLGNISTVSSGKAYDGRSLHITLHGEHDNVNRGIFINFLDPVTMSVTDPDGDLHIYYATDPGWFDIFATYLTEHSISTGQEARQLSLAGMSSAAPYDTHLYFTETVDWDKTLGDYTLTTQTTTHPYLWTFTLSAPLSADIEADKLKFMERQSYVLMGLFKDLDQVEWKYTCLSEEKTVLFTPEELDPLLGERIEHYYKTSQLLSLGTKDVQEVLNCADALVND